MMVNNENNPKVLATVTGVTAYCTGNQKKTQKSEKFGIFGDFIESQAKVKKRMK